MTLGFNLPIYHSNVISDPLVIHQYEKTSEKLLEDNPDGWGFAWAKYCNSWNSLSVEQDIIFTTDYFPGLGDKIDEGIRSYTDQLGNNRDKLPLDECVSWINATTKYKFQERHTHEPCILSGCFYITEYENQGNINFVNPLVYKGLSKQKDSISKRSLVSDYMLITPKSGDLIIFPSHIEHFVDQNMSDNTRFSVCFNIGSSKL